MAKSIRTQRKIFAKAIHDRDKTKVPVVRIIVIWSLYLLSLIGGFFWLSIENERILAIYHQSTRCAGYIQIQYQENCIEDLTGTINQVLFIYNGWNTNRYGGSPRSGGDVAAVDLDFVLPDGSTAKTRISKQVDYQQQADKEISNDLWFFLKRIKLVEKGDILTVTRWHGKIISIKAHQSPAIYTLDHPENSAKILYTRAGGFFRLLFIVPLTWSGYEIIRKRR